MRNTLIDWANEDNPTFGYPNDRVEALLASTQKLVEETRLAVERGEIMEAARRAMAFGLLQREKALAQWLPQGATALGEEARKMVELARSIDRDHSELPMAAKLKLFLEQCGGKEHFEEVFTALSSAGCLHDIANLIAAAALESRE